MKARIALALLLPRSVGAFLPWFPGLHWPAGDVAQRGGAKEATTVAAHSEGGDSPTGANPQRRAAVLAGILYSLGAAQPVQAVGRGPKGQDPRSDTKTLAEQMEELNAFPTMNGVWKFREYDTEGRVVATGMLTFRGNPGAGKGTVEYSGDGDPMQMGRGRWSVRPDSFARAPLGGGAVIQQKALWDLRKSKTGTFAYTGVVKVDGITKGRPDAVVKGEIVQLIKGGDPNRARGGYEKTVGTFSANLRRLLTDEENDAAAQGGPQPVLVSVATV